MAKYAVNKFFGHFWQCWELEASSEDDAWARAERDGDLSYQQVYENELDKESKGYVVNISDNRQQRLVKKEDYDRWMDEAIMKGMIVPDYLR